MDDCKPTYPTGGRRPWFRSRRRIANAIVLALAIFFLLVAMLLAFCFITGQLPFVDWSTTR